MIRLTSPGIEGFSKSLLAARYDDPKPIPDCHREWWELCCSDSKQVAIAAPRDHAKSTAVTFAYVLAEVLFRTARHVLILSSNEDMAAQFVGDIRVELSENEALCQYFDVRGFVKESETELIVQFRDGERFRIIAKGAEQRMRGLKWERKRPDLVVGDDLEDDEIVATSGRREKFKRWFYGAVLPIVREGGRIRVVGTILHHDSLLENLMPRLKDPETVVTPLKIWTDAKSAWKSVKYRAHDPEFKHILWPQRWPKERLQAKRADFADRGLLDVYGQEYLNDPIDTSTAYFRDDDFLKWDERDEEGRKREARYYAAVDFAVSKSQRADYTAIVVVGATDSGDLVVKDVRRGRWDPVETIEELFIVQQRYRPDLIFAEKGQIQMTMGPFLNTEMARRGIYLNIQPMMPTKDKESRARAFQGRMRAGGVYFDKDSEWYPDLHEEMRRFPKGAHDDQVDALAWIGLGLEQIVEALTPEELEDEEYEEMMEDYAMGANETTGY